MAIGLKMPPGRGAKKENAPVVEQPMSEEVKDLQEQVEDEGFL